MYQRDLMCFPYMHTMNQGAVFYRALVLGGLMLEGGWNTFNLAYNAHKLQIEILQKYIDKDGACTEGPTYLCQTMHAVLPSLMAWNRLNRKQWHNGLGKLFGKTVNYLEVLGIGTTGKGVPMDDSRTDWYGGDSIAILAKLYPNSYAMKILPSCIEEGTLFKSSGTQKNSGGMLSLVYGPDKIKEYKPTHESVKYLKTSNIVRSTRTIDKNTVSLLFSGFSKESGHGHSDVGSLVLEINDKSVLTDPGVMEYYVPDAIIMRNRDMHNCLDVKIGKELNNVVNKISATRFVAGGNEIEFNCKINLNGNIGGMSEYNRSIFSKSPEEFILYDNGETSNCGIVAVYFMTTDAVQLSNKEVQVNFENGSVIIYAEWAEDIKLEECFIDYKYQKLSRIRFEKKIDKTFSLTTNISIEFNV